MPETFVPTPADPAATFSVPADAAALPATPGAPVDVGSTDASVRLRAVAIGKTEEEVVVGAGGAGGSVDGLKGRCVPLCVVLKLRTSERESQRYQLKL